MLGTMRAAIVHYWLLNRRGGEKVLDALCRLLPLPARPQADINRERGGLDCAFAADSRSAVSTESKRSERRSAVAAGEGGA